MVTQHSEDLVQRQQDASSLCEQQKSLMLSTLAEGDTPCASYAPFYRDEAGVFYLYLSELANHCQNLLRHQVAGVMIIRDESETRNAFARERLGFQCKVGRVDRADSRYEGILDQLAARQGETVTLLRTLNDFHLFALMPVSGSYVVGFGKAFEIDVASGRLTHIDADQLALKQS